VESFSTLCSVAALYASSWQEHLEELRGGQYHQKRKRSYVGATARFPPGPLALGNDLIRR
jgi:hypothetical protein